MKVLCRFLLPALTLADRPRGPRRHRFKEPCFFHDGEKTRTRLNVCLPVPVPLWSASFEDALYRFFYLALL